MQHTTRARIAVALTVVTIPLAACGGKSDRQTAAGDVANPSSSTPASGSTATDSATPKSDSTTDHHSKLGGAVVGAAAGHLLGHHAVAGAAAGAMIQHERNKHDKPR
jgi:hypothetical protein